MLPASRVLPPAIKLERSPAPGVSGTVPVVEYTLVRSALACPPMLGRLAPTTPDALVTEALDASAPPGTLSGRLSRLPPKTDDGAIARI